MRVNKLLYIPKDDRCQSRLFYTAKVSDIVMGERKKLSIIQTG